MKFTLLIASASAFAPGAAPRAATQLHESGADLEELAVKLNPIIKFWDPLGLAKADFWGQPQSAAVGFLREAEVKHGRVAMAAFVGYIVQANHIFFPWKHLGGADIDMSSMTPPEQWDAMPVEAKWQIILGVGFLEIFREGAGQHYMSGGKPGSFPTWDTPWGKNLYDGEYQDEDLKIPHFTPFKSHWDPLGVQAKIPQEKKDKSLLSEINNGRLAMLGIFGFLSETKVPGSVPILSNIDGIKAYAGDYMQPFEGNFHIFDTL